MIQPPDPHASPFDVLGQPKQFAIEPKSLEKKFFHLQRQFHPDYYQMKSEMEKLYSEARSSQLNQSYQILKSPTKRAEFLLSEVGIDLSETGGSYTSDPQLIMAIMEKREAIEDNTSDHEALKRMMDEEKNQLDEIAQQFAKAYEEKAYEQAKKLAVEMIYIEKIVKEIQEILPANN
eukprot:CAMPEP_0201556170 /NCGR_PEP_ID=MMETSP0173_2-20130828/53660_1 /ASSEMBLY_ACC=CAM_ASM_000268 /TAXON_ID=218659 /ORGANISM="Vexillifera sp., Strain DIVA3 564/2" /LENGTH=176 /DNA_ID=CAMNT_0047968307 /DNA_START=153 /DNA_END=681 /DNA_ORIENTATION=-